MQKSNLNFFEQLVSNNMTNLRIKFNDIVQSPLRDTSKDDENERDVVYLFKNKYGSDGKLQGITDESYPNSFQDFAEREIKSKLDHYRSWLNELIDTQSKDRIRIVIQDHLKRATELLVQMDGAEPIVSGPIEEIVHLLKTKQETVTHQNSKRVGENISHDKRGENKKNETIIPENAFWEKATELYQTNPDRCITKDKHPSGYLIDNLYRARFVGYQKVDKDRQSSQSLSKSTIRRRLDDFPEKWRR